MAELLTLPPLNAAGAPVGRPRGVVCSSSAGATWNGNRGCAQSFRRLRKARIDSHRSSRGFTRLVSPHASQAAPPAPSEADTSAQDADFANDVAFSPSTSSTKRSFPFVSAEEAVKTLKWAAYSQKVPTKEVLRALYSLQMKHKQPDDGYLTTLGGLHSPGNTWKLVYGVRKEQLEKVRKGETEDGGSYIPICGVERFDAEAMESENGAYFGKWGYITFKGPFNFSGRRLNRVYNKLKIKVLKWGPFEFDIGEFGREPGKPDPFFLLFYVDDEIVVAQGRGGGSAYWVRCTRKEPLE